MRRLVPQRPARCEDGTIPERYPLQVTDSADYPERTEANVRAADATLILTRGSPDRGTALTYKLALRLKKPCYLVDLREPDVPATVKTWLANQRVSVLNVAGPRRESSPLCKRASMKRPPRICAGC